MNEKQSKATERIAELRALQVRLDNVLRGYSAPKLSASLFHAHTAAEDALQEAIDESLPALLDCAEVLAEIGAMATHRGMLTLDIEETLRIEGALAAITKATQGA